MQASMDGEPWIERAKSRWSIVANNGLAIHPERDSNTIISRSGPGEWASQVIIGFVEGSTTM